MGRRSLLPVLKARLQTLLGLLFGYLLSLSRRIVLHSLSNSVRCGTLRITALDGTTTTVGAKSAASCGPAIQVHNEVFWMRVLLFGDMGFAQSYMLHEISTSELTAVFEFFIRNGQTVNKATTTGLLTSIIGRVSKLVPRVLSLPWKTINNICTARLNATAHYSLSNDMF